MELHLFISALVLGAVSSFHCVGMCGVFAFSIPTQHFSALKKVLAILLYNLGRITSYAFVGLLFGLLGRQLFLAGFQRWFAIISGLAILLIVIQSLLKRPVFHLPGYNRVTRLISKLILKFMGKPTLRGIYLLGVANGFLPCGLVYLAITGALAIGTVGGAAAFMAAFGLGTLPAMFLLSYCRFIIGISVRNKIRQAVPFFAATMAVMLILRGMNLNIPYLSPAFSAGKNIISCH
jgi:sulfite exporter TauE/SafE